MSGCPVQAHDDYGDFWRGDWGERFTPARTPREKEGGREREKQNANPQPLQIGGNRPLW